jgi:hypothetical protein
MKRLALLCAFGVLGGLTLAACSSANDSTSNTTVESVVVIPGTDVVITAEQAATLIGKTEAIAEADAHSNGWVWRVGRRDGEEFALTMDYCQCRVTVSIDNDIVTESVVG